MNTNPVLPQDRVADLFDTFNKYGYVMFPQQRAIYDNLFYRITKGSILEAGCGVGLGSAIIYRNAEISTVVEQAENPNHRGYLFVATDVIPKNVHFAKCLYPWINFKVWDINLPGSHLQLADTVVCVECIEHIENPQAGVKNLIDAAKKEVWITTPNNYKAYSPPENPYHVAEFSIGEMCGMIGVAARDRLKAITLHHWETFETLPNNTEVSPLVYHITLKESK